MRWSPMPAGFNRRSNATCRSKRLVGAAADRGPFSNCYNASELIGFEARMGCIRRGGELGRSTAIIRNKSFDRLSMPQGAL